MGLLVLDSLLEESTLNPRTTKMADDLLKEGVYFNCFISVTLVFMAD